MSTAATSVTQLLDELVRSRFYGTLEIKLEAGRVVLLRKTETLKPCSDNYGISPGETNAPHR